MHGTDDIPVFFPPCCKTIELIRLNFPSLFYFTRALDPAFRSARLAAKISPYICININVRMFPGRLTQAISEKPVRVHREAHTPLRNCTPRGYIYIASDEISSVLLIAPLLALPNRFLRRQMFLLLRRRRDLCSAGPFTCTTGRREFLRAVVFSAGRYPGKIYDRRST